jgi:hypothetical protein
MHPIQTGDDINFLHHTHQFARESFIMHMTRINTLAVGITLMISACTSHGQVIYDSTQLLPPNSAIGEDFGSSVALGPNYMIVGSEFADDTQTQSGAVSVYSRSTGSFLRKLIPPTPLPSDLFGSSVAIQGDTVVAGARIRGLAYLFDASNGNVLRTLRVHRTAHNRQTSASQLRSMVTLYS